MSAAPGLHLRELARRSGLELGVLRHHLDGLREARLVATQDDGGYVRYFATAVAPAERPVLALLQRRAPRVLAAALLAGPLDVSAAARRAGLRDSTASRGLAALESAGVVATARDGRRTVVRLRDPQATYRGLLRVKASWMETLVDHAVELFEAR